MPNGIIKAGDADAAIRGMYAVDLRDVSAEAAAALEVAKSEARSILEEARTRAAAERGAAREAGHGEGYQTGLREGRQAGREEGLREIRAQFARDQASVLAALTEMIDGFRDRRERLFLAARRDVVVLAITIAQRLVSGMAREPEDSAGIASDACVQALSLIGEATCVDVRLNPDDLAALQRLVDGPGAPEDDAPSNAARTLLATEHVRFIADDAVAPGGAVVRSADCEVNAEVSDRVERIGDELVAGWRVRQRELGL